MAALEDIYDDIGGFSRFQLLMLVCVHTMKSMAGWSMMQMAFGNIIPDYHCSTDSDDSQSNFSRNNTVYLDSQSAHSNESWNACSINDSQCTHYVFMGPARTVVSEWALVCDLHWIKPTITSVQMAGVLVGAFLAGQCGDYFGRKKTTYGWYLGHALFNLVAAFSVSWQMFMAMRLFIGMGIGAILVMSVPYPAEFLPMKWRIIVPALAVWQWGIGLFAGAAWLLEDWSHLHLACAALSAPGLLGYFYFPESVRWLSVQGRLQEAHDVIEKMARVNGKPVPSYTMDALQKIYDIEKTSRASGQKYSYIDIVRGKRMFLTTVIFAFIWASLSITYYGLSFGVSSLAGNIYLNIFLMGVMGIPGNFLTYFLANKIGRRKTFSGFFVLGSAASFGCVVAYLAAPSDTRGAIIIGLSLTAKLAVDTSWCASQMWVVESYPTVIRNLGYGAANTAARIGGILSSFAINLNDMFIFSFVLVGSLQLAGVLLAFLVPETRDSVLHESILTKNQSIEIKPIKNSSPSKDQEEKNFLSPEKSVDA